MTIEDAVTAVKTWLGMMRKAHDGNEFATEFIDAAWFLAKMAIQESSKNDWISVADRLPDTIPCNAGTAYSEAVVVLTDNKKVLTAVYDGNDFICDASFWEAEGDRITHWKSVLPLPELPKEALIDGNRHCLDLERRDLS